MKKGDQVEVSDPGLIMLQRIIGKPQKGEVPNNVGWVNEIMDDGDIMIEFPIGKDNPDEHSQIAPYSKNEIFETKWEEKYNYKYPWAKREIKDEE